MLSDRTKNVVRIAIAQPEDAEEILAAIETPAALSERAEKALAIAVASNEIAAEISAIILAGSGSLSDEAKRDLEIALADKAAYAELVVELET